MFSFIIKLMVNSKSNEFGNTQWCEAIGQNARSPCLFGSYSYHPLITLAAIKLYILSRYLLLFKDMKLSVFHILKTELGSRFTEPLSLMLFLNVQNGTNKLIFAAGTINTATWCQSHKLTFTRRYLEILLRFLPS